MRVRAEHRAGNTRWHILVTRKRSRRTGISNAEKLWGALGLVSLGAILAWAVLRVVPGIERNILSGVQNAISPIITWPVMVSVHGHTTTIAGKTASEDERLALISAIEDSPGVRDVVDRLTLTADSRGTAMRDDPAVDRTSETVATRSTEPEPLASIDNPPLPEDPAEQLAQDASDELAQDFGAPDSEGLAQLPDEPPESTESDGPTALAVETTSDPIATPSALPELSIRLIENALTLDGRMDPSIDLTALIQPALKAFDPNYLTNRIDTTEATADADWLEPLTGLFDEMKELSSPRIDITDRQVTLGGTAASRETHDQIISRALQMLGEYSLVERISVAPPSAAVEPLTDSATTAGDATADLLLGEPPESIPGNLPPDAGPDAGPEGGPDAAPSAAPGALVEKAAGELNDKSSTSLVNTRAALHKELEALEDRRIQFKQNSDVFADGSEELVDIVADLFKRFPDIDVEIEGHTDTSGEASANMRLSQQRAVTVREALVERGVSRDRLVAYGFGEGVPLVDNATPEGRARNRRIEFRLPASGS